MVTNTKDLSNRYYRFGLYIFALGILKLSILVINYLQLPVIHTYPHRDTLFGRRGDGMLIFIVLPLIIFNDLLAVWPYTLIYLLCVFGLDFLLFDILDHSALKHTKKHGYIGNICALIFAAVLLTLFIALLVQVARELST